MYRPLKFFGSLGTIFLVAGLALGVRFLVLWAMDPTTSNIQSLILMSVFLIFGILLFMVGLLGDMVANNRKLLEDIQYRIRKMDCDAACKNEDQNK